MSEANELHPGHWAATTPEKPAIIMAESGDSMTYAELEDAANRLSHVFSDAGFKPGDHIAFCMENRLEYLAIMWGAHYAGLYYTAISSRLTTEELAYIIEDSGSRAFLTTPYIAKSLVGLDDVLAKLDIRLSVGGDLPGFERYEDAIAAASNEPLLNRVEAQPMLYSSGTPGRPKGVKPRMSGDPLGKGEALTTLIQFLFGGTNESVYVSPAPLYPRTALSQCAASLLHTVPSIGRDHRRSREVRRRRLPCGDRKVRRDPQSMGPDDVRSHAQARRCGSRAIRPLQSRLRNPRRSALPYRHQGEDDGMVGPDHS
jgi:acyl-CoA synthetase (AMP-forming)/AMP-acid ligase II